MHKNYAGSWWLFRHVLRSIDSPYFTLGSIVAAVVRFLMNFMEISDKYFRVSSIPRLHAMHDSAKSLEARATAPPEAGCPGGDFTASQRDAWKMHFVAAFREHGCEFIRARDWRGAL